MTGDLSRAADKWTLGELARELDMPPRPFTLRAASKPVPCPTTAATSGLSRPMSLSARVSTDLDQFLAQRGSPASTNIAMLPGDVLIIPEGFF